MAAFTPVGVEFVAKGIRQFESRINHVNDGILELSDSIEKMGEQAAETATSDFNALQESLLGVQDDVRGLGSVFGQQASSGGGLGSFLFSAANLTTVIGGIGSVVGGAITAVVNLGTAMIGAAIDGAKFLADKLIGVISVSTEMATAFESATNVLGIAASADIAKGITSFEQLSDAALAVGGDVRLIGVDAMQSAEAITGLYKAGLTTEQIFGGNLQDYLENDAQLMGALRASIDLAAASELNMVEASELATTLMFTFGSEAQELGMTIDQWVVGAMNNMVQAADASVTSVPELRDALQNAGPILASFGFNLSDVNTALAVMSQMGIRGSEAGTALRSAFSVMTGGGKKAKKAMEELGVSLYDEQGTMFELSDIVLQFADKMNSAKEVMVEVGGRTAEQNAELKRLRGMYASTAQDLGDYEKGITGVGQSEEARRKSIDKLQIKMVNLGAAIQDLESIQGTAVKRTIAWTQEELDQRKKDIAGPYGRTALDSILKNGAEGWMNMAAAVGDAATIQEVSAKKAESLAAKTEALEGSLQTLSIMIGIPFRELKKEFLGAALPIVEKYGPLVADQFIALGEALGGFGDVVFAMDWDAIIGDLFTGDLSSLIEGFSLAGLELGIPQEAITFITNLITKGQELIGWLQEAIPAAIATASSYWSGTLWPAMQDVWGWVQDTAIPTALEIWAIIQEEWPAALQTASDFWTNTLKPAIDGIMVAFNNIAAFWDENGPSIQQIAEQTFEAFSEMMVSLSEDLIPFVVEQIEKISAWFEENGPLITEHLARLSLAWQTVWTAVEEFWEIVEPIIDGLITIILELIETMLEVVVGDWEGVWESMETILWTIVDSLIEAVGSFFTFILTMMGGTTWEPIWAQWSANWDMFTTILGLWWDGIVLWFEGLWEDIKQLGADFAAGFAQGVEDAKQMVVDAVGSIVTGAIDAAKKLLGIKSPSTVFAEVGMSVGEGMAMGIHNSLPLVGSALGEMSSILTGGLSSMGQMGLALSGAGAGAMAPGGAVGAVAAPPVYSSRNLSVGPVTIQNGMDEARFMALFRRAIRTEMGGI